MYSCSFNFLYISTGEYDSIWSDMHMSIVVHLSLSTHRLSPTEFLAESNVSAIANAERNDQQSKSECMCLPSEVLLNDDHMSLIGCGQSVGDEDK